MTHTDHPTSRQRHREAAGRLLEVVGDDHPRQMIICRKNPGKQNSAYGSTSSSPPDDIRGLLVLGVAGSYFSSPTGHYSGIQMLPRFAGFAALAAVLVLPHRTWRPPPRKYRIDQSLTQGRRGDRPGGAKQSISFNTRASSP